MKYDGGLICSLLRDENPSVEEKYPPGRQVERIDPSTNLVFPGMVMDIPFPHVLSNDNSLPNYMILFANETTASVPFGKMAGIIPSPPIDVDDLDSQNSLLPLFL